MADFSRTHVGDRILVRSREFDDWLPTMATVIRFSLKYPGHPELGKNIMIRILLDRHPFPDVYAYPIEELEFDILDNNFSYI